MHQCEKKQNADLHKSHLSYCVHILAHEKLTFRMNLPVSFFNTTPLPPLPQIMMALLIPLYLISPHSLPHPQNWPDSDKQPPVETSINFNEQPNLLSTFLGILRLAAPN